MNTTKRMFWQIRNSGRNLFVLAVLAALACGAPQAAFSRSKYLEKSGEGLWQTADGEIVNSLEMRTSGKYSMEGAIVIEEPDRNDKANAFYQEMFPEIYKHASQNRYYMAGDVLESCFSFRMLLNRSPHRNNDKLWDRWKRYYTIYHCLANFIPQPVITVKGRDSLNQYRGMNMYDMTDLYFRDLRAWFLGEPMLYVGEEVFPRNKVFFDFFGTGLAGWKKYVDYFYLQCYVTGPAYEVIELFPRDNWRKKEPETLKDFETLLTNMEARFNARAALLDKAPVKKK